MKPLDNKDIHTADPKLRKLVLVLDAGTSGTDSYEAYLVSKDMYEEALSDYAWERAVEHGAAYGMYPLGYYLEMSEEELEENNIDLDDDCYTEDISGHWEVYNKDVHDNHLVFGSNGSFRWGYLIQ